MAITEEMIRRKAEHHDGLLADLEELSLHQMELEGINEVLGACCRKLRILYLQNNVIPRLTNLQHLKELRYLNMALNNLTVVDGLASCEFLAKLDLTVNFVDVDGLAASMAALSPLLHLRELFLMGNPCLEWPGARHYVIASLPQLERLDGKDITRAERIAAAQQYKVLRAELRALAAAKSGGSGGGGGGGGAAGGAAAAAAAAAADDEGEDSDGDAWTPANRVRAARELAESKSEKEKRARDMAPERRDYKAEQATSVAAIRGREAAGGTRQCNEGRWEFRLEDDDGGGNTVVRLALSRYMDTSLIDVDVQPAYISVIIKSKVFRLAFPAEVRAGDAKCQRSTTTGELVVTVPKVTATPMAAAVARKEKTDAAAAAAASGRAGGGAGGGGGRTKMGDEMAAASRAVKLAGIAASAPPADAAADGTIAGGSMLFKEVAAAAVAGTPVAPPAAAVGGRGSSRAPPPAAAVADDSDVPPLE